MNIGKIEVEISKASLTAYKQYKLFCEIGEMYLLQNDPKVLHESDLCREISNCLQIDISRAIKKLSEEEHDEVMEFWYGLSLMGEIDFLEEAIEAKDLKCKQKK